MLYQKLLLGQQPYFVNIMNSSDGFQMHRHPEMELSYCLNGSYAVSVENAEYLLHEGDLAIISPMAAHGIPKSKRVCRKLTVEFGPTLMGEHFHAFTTLNTTCTVLHLKQENAPVLYKQLTALLAESVEIQEQEPPFHDLLLKGNMYRLGALLLQGLLEKEAVQHTEKQMQHIAKIECALTAVYNRYYEPLNIDTVSTECGYSKSNFCKVFKSITGDTFHNVLNRHRVEIACLHLKNSNTSIEEIAQRVGFTDIKSFCRVFKSIMGESAGSYKKKQAPHNDLT